MRGIGGAQPGLEGKGAMVIFCWGLTIDGCDGEEVSGEGALVDCVEERAAARRWLPARSTGEDVTLGAVGMDERERYWDVPWDRTEGCRSRLRDNAAHDVDDNLVATVVMGVVLRSLILVGGVWDLAGVLLLPRPGFGTNAADPLRSLGRTTGWSLGRPSRVDARALGRRGGKGGVRDAYATPRKSVILPVSMRPT